MSFFGSSKPTRGHGLKRKLSVNDLESLGETETENSSAMSGGEKGDYSIVDGVLKAKADLTCEDMYLLDCELAYSQLRKKKNR